MSLLRITVLFVSKQKTEAHAYILLQIYPLKASKKYYHDGCKSHTKKWWQPHKKNCTCKRRIHDFYVFCIDECKAIILASGTINCYCCCCCILMSRYIFKRGVEVTVFLIPAMAMSPLQKYGGDLYTICIQKVYTNLLYCTFCILDVYIKKNRKCDWSSCIFFLYISKRMCTKSTQQIRIWWLLTVYITVIHRSGGG